MTQISMSRRSRMGARFSQKRNYSGINKIQNTSLQNTDVQDAPPFGRRHLLQSLALGGTGLALSGCSAFDFLRDRNNPIRNFMARANDLTYGAHRTFVGRNTLAPEFTKADIRQSQRANGTTNPQEIDYLTEVKAGFENYTFKVYGLVNKPLSLRLDQLKNMQNRTQITRHDCVEGWSTIAEWTGVPLKTILDMAELKSDAHYVVFECYDTYNSRVGRVNYYESVDLIDAFHPQTILAHTMNGDPLPIRNGAPLRVRIERQLGYKMAKYLKSIRVVSHLDTIGFGKGGYWPDNGYEWYAGI